jgi:hypothetical protein
MGLIGGLVFAFGPVFVAYDDTRHGRQNTREFDQNLTTNFVKRGVLGAGVGMAVGLSILIPAEKKRRRQN